MEKCTKMPTVLSGSYIQPRFSQPLFPSRGPLLFLLKGRLILMHQPLQKEWQETLTGLISETEASSTQTQETRFVCSTFPSQSLTHHHCLSLQNQGEGVPRSGCKMQQQKDHWGALPFFISKLHLAHKKPVNVINYLLQDMILINYWVIQSDSCVKCNLHS